MDAGMGVGGQAGHGYMGVREGRQACMRAWEGVHACMHGRESGRVSG